MSNQGLIIEERSRDIGDFLVGRLIPFRKKRMVGPFIFIDHMGPSKIGPTTYLEVDQHPHIGLSTLTYLLEGEIDHKDSIGTRQRIKAGSVNWMTAGEGVVHTERTPKEFRDGNIYAIHGYQIWVALPKEQEGIKAQFHHTAKEDLPYWSDGKASFKLIAGNAFGKTSPVPVYSDLFMVELKTEGVYKFENIGQLKGEIGICIIEGSIKACGQKVAQGNMLVAKEKDFCTIDIEPNSHLFLFGGLPFEEERHIYWNFVSSSKDKIEEAKERWRTKNFKMVENDESYVPLPS